MTPEIIVLVLDLDRLDRLHAVRGRGLWRRHLAGQHGAASATKKERALLYGAIGPVWEANHVWLIFVVVMLFGAFPPAFAAICQALWLPLVLAVAGIVFRGVGFAFRSYSVGAEREQLGWEIVFAIGSTAAPFFLGMAVGALASGRLWSPTRGSSTATTPPAGFRRWRCSWAFSPWACALPDGRVSGARSPQPGDRSLTDLWRQRALATGIWMGILTVVGLLYVSTDAPFLWDGFRHRSGALVAGSVVAGLLVARVASEPL